MLPTAATVAACGGTDGGLEVVRADSAGVEIVTSSAEDRPLDWTFEELFRLGGADDGPEAFTRVNADQAGADRDGNLYVLDGQSSRVVVFGPDGSHLRSMGAPGEGPGELRFPVSFAGRAEGTASVFDIGKGSMVTFGPDGDALPQLPFGHYTEAGTLRHFALTPEGFVVAASVAAGEGVRRRIELRSWSERVPDAPAPDTAILTELELPVPQVADFGCMSLALAPLFSPLVQWDTEGSSVVAVDGSSYVVKVFELDGTPVRSLRRDLPARPASEADAIAEAGLGLRMMSGAGRCEATAEEVVEGRGFTSELPAIRNVLLAPSGEIWVERFVPRGVPPLTPAPIDVFDPSGAYMGTLPANTPFPLLLFADGRVAFVEKDALDIERIAVARVIRGP